MKTSHQEGFNWPDTRPWISEIRSFKGRLFFSAVASLASPLLQSLARSVG